MHHLLEHINQHIKIDNAKIRTQQYIKLNTGAKEIQRVNPGGPYNSSSKEKCVSQNRQSRRTGMQFREKQSFQP